MYYVCCPPNFCCCGSRKKYKKCCGLNEAAGLFLPASQRTGTPYDDYMDVFPILGRYGQKIRRFEEDGRELNRLLSQIEKRCRPGKEGGITNSFFMSWVNFDLRIGTTLETIAEQVITDPMIKRLAERVLSDPMTARKVEEGPTLIRQLADSYLTFYQIIESVPKATIVKELGTGLRFKVFYIRELYEIDPAPGEVWFSRLVGPPEQALFYTMPYIYAPETRGHFERAVRL